MLGRVKALNTIRMGCSSHTLDPQERRGLKEALGKDLEPVLAHIRTREHGGAQDLRKPLTAQTQHQGEPPTAKGI